MCTKPSIPQAQQYQTAVSPVYKEGSTEDEAARRGRRGTILATAMNAPPASGGKTLLGQ